MSAISIVRQQFAPADPRKPSAAITVESLESRCLMSGAPQIILKPSKLNAIRGVHLGSGPSSNVNATVPGGRASERG